jgi:alkylation response protein AidB-like acyl-CoA dehydrogenase
MIAMVEANQAWLESITYQMCNMSYKDQTKHLGGPIALLKYHVTRAAHEIADEAVQIFGGRGLTQVCLKIEIPRVLARPQYGLKIRGANTTIQQTGMGTVVEMYQRTYKFDSIYGGAEEVMADLGVRQALKFMPKAML